MNLARNVAVATLAVAGGLTGLLAVGACAQDRFPPDDDETTAPSAAVSTGASGTPENTDILCTDGVDNDVDGLTDCCDPECGVLAPCQPNGAPETNDAACSDCIDNDNNGFTDCDDFDCATAGVTVCGPPENTDALCVDGIDNDNNGFTDCDDFGCSMNPQVTVCP